MKSKRVLISGASGLIGTALTASLRSQGASVSHLVRREVRSDQEISWQPGSLQLDPAVLAGFDAVVNLSGASIAKLPWTKSYRATLRSSRINTTATLATALAELSSAAPHFVSASAVGFYGSRPGELLDENSSPGRSFLADLCVDWEQTARAAGDQSRVALLRTAPVLHPDAVLKPLIALTRLGVAGPLGGGRQIWPWISLDDEVRAIEHIIANSLSGPVNLSGPELASANDIGRELAKQLHRPFLLPAPAWALRVVLSPDAADALLLEDAEVVPEKLLASGFKFKHQSISEAIAAGLAAFESPQGS